MTKGPFSPPSADAARSSIAKLGDYAHLDFVKRGQHLLIVDRAYPDEPIARVTATTPGRCTAAFRNQRGRWEPLLIEDGLDAVMSAVVDMLGPCLENR